MTDTKRRWCLDCRHCCPTDSYCACAISDHRYVWVKPPAPAFFAQVARVLAEIADPAEAAVLSREAALKLGFDATQLWIEAQHLRALRRPR